jgi:hypothetical protein
MICLCFDYRRQARCQSFVQGFDDFFFTHVNEEKECLRIESTIAILIVRLVFSIFFSDQRRGKRNPTDFLQ